MFFKFDSVYKKELFKNIQTKRIIYFQMKKEALADFPTKASFNMECGYESYFIYIIYCLLTAVFAQLP